MATAKKADKRKNPPNSGNRIHGDLESFVTQVWLPRIQAANTSWKIDEGNWRLHIRPFWGPHRLDAIQPQAVEDWLNIFAAKTYSPSTRNRILSTMRSIFRAACDNGYLNWHSSPLAGLKTPPINKRRPQVPDRAIIEDLLARLRNGEEPAAKAILLMLLTNAGKAGVLRARWEDLAPDGESIFIHAARGNPRLLILPPEAKTLIGSLKSRGVSPWLFPARDKSKPLNDVFGYWNGLRTALGMPGLLIKDVQTALRGFNIE